MPRWGFWIAAMVLLSVMPAGAASGGGSGVSAPLSAVRPLAPVPSMALQAVSADNAGAAGSPAAKDHEAEPVRHNRLKAIGASLLLPGLGQLTTGHKDHARAFFAAEAAIVIAYTAFTVQGNVHQNDYIDYAGRFAGVSDAEGRPDWYYHNLGQYNSSDDYIDEIERTARAMYGNDLEARAEYVERNRPGPDETWQWRSEADRLEYHAKRKSSRNAFRSASHTLGVALLNRLVSAVDAAILAGKSDNRHAFYYAPDPDGSGYLCVSWTLD